MSDLPLIVDFADAQGGKRRSQRVISRACTGRTGPFGFNGHIAKVDGVGARDHADGEGRLEVRLIPTREGPSGIGRLWRGDQRGERLGGGRSWGYLKLGEGVIILFAVMVPNRLVVSRHV